MQIEMNIEDLELRITREDARLTVAFAGGLDTRTAPETEMELIPLLSGVRELELDFAQLEYITSAGLRVLLRAHKIMDKQGSMQVLHVNESVREVLEMTGFTSVLTIG